MSRWSLFVGVVAVCLIGITPAIGVFYTWTGDGDGTTWPSAGNWDPVGPCSGSTCYPSASGDEALIDRSLGDPITIELSDETIDELYVLSEDLTFDDGDSSDPELQVSTFVAGYDEVPPPEQPYVVTITFRRGAKIVRSSSQP